jgi:type III restriction enzyme
MDEVSKLIRSTMRVLIVDGIKYTKIGDDSFYAQELFKEEELVGYLEQNMIESKKSIYDYVVYDSKGVEKTFAEKLDNNERVIVYAKLPSWFKINTPLGSYNPDWAVVVKDESGNKKIFFVLETKGSILTEDLRPKEKAKIACGYKHFEALGGDVQFKEEENFEDFIGNI